jgi:chromate transporter
MSPWAVYLLFLKFGLRAFGGPVAQINDQRDELVVEGKWISEKRFNKVYAVYQLLPGPEATELACYFGRLAGGRVGGLMGGLGFITPGLLLMLLFSWFYAEYGIGNGVFQAVFKGLQPAMAAIVFRSAHKIGDFAFRDHENKEWDWGLAFVGALSAFETVLNVNYFISKIHLVIVYVLWRWAGFGATKGAPGTLFWRALCVFWTAAPILVFIGTTGAYGKLDLIVPMGMGIAAKLGNTQGAQFVIGLVSGLVTFGGAYTALPFIQYETVISGGWILNQVFLDSLSVGSVLPTPLVMFVLMIGYMSGINIKRSYADALIGAALMTLGMFLPAFIMPVCFGDTLERAISGKGTFALILDAVAATVVGQIAITALLLLRTAVVMPTAAIIFFATIQTLYGLPHKFTPVLVVFCAGIAGQVLFY